jgi:N6-adenosine-specific RNA methylase IME4
MFKYGAILADPPWAFDLYSNKGNSKSPAAQYQIMSDEEILALPVGQLAGRDCMLFLWATWPRLPLAVQCVEAWGFRYVTGCPWIKRTRKGRLRWGPGYVFRTVSEVLLVGRVGESQHRVTDQPGILEGIAREHSRKPPEARTLVERMTPNAFRCELFAREPWPGNDVWGNETEKFSADSPDDPTLHPGDGHHDLLRAADEPSTL